MFLSLGLEKKYMTRYKVEICAMLFRISCQIEECANMMFAYIDVRKKRNRTGLKLNSISYETYKEKIFISRSFTNYNPE